MSEVFLSYRQIDASHRRRALDFANRLIGCGISVILDQLVREGCPGGPPEGWPKWSSDRAIQTSKILILGSKDWFQCFDGTQEPGAGLGAACEAGDIRDRIYRSGGVNEDVRIVLFEETDSADISTTLQRYHHFKAEHDFNDIVKWLDGTLPLVVSGSSLPDWPLVAPPLADHTQSRSAFERLIIRSAEFRYLPIMGNSETGKTHLTKQFLANAFKIDGLVCGRFDFKGSSDMDMELRTFAEHLNVSEPSPNTGASNQLGQIFSSLKKSERPTLLIFDTFELAGDAERWIKGNLLLALRQYHWLRVIVVGQQVPQPHGEPWSGYSFPPIHLSLPSVEDWFEYGKVHRPDITLEFVQRAHAYGRGKVTLLSQLFGPAA